MPRTRLQNLIPDYRRFQNDLRAEMSRSSVSTRTAGSKSRSSYSRWIREPWKFTFGNLAEFLKNLNLPEEKEKDLVWELYTQARKR